ncbi:neurotensin receptor type 1-like [Saccostrea cucullata]|uniref:neurotensin receptor type 1-like n=1 Tax=Saccostrea cuccullata TaxID=36930 RepID=UPI002ED046B6
MMAACKNLSEDNFSIPVEHNSMESILEKKIHFIFMEVGVPAVSAFGLVGNILNLLVLTKEKVNHCLTKMEKSAHIGLIALAVSDFMFCLLALLFTILPPQETYRERNGVLYYRWLGNGFITFFIINSTWLIVVMAGERYLAVCHPFKARKLISVKKTKIAICLVYMICILSIIPLFFESEIVETTCIDGSRLYRIERRKNYNDQTRRMLWSIIFDFIPCIALLFFNICLVWKIRRAKRIHRELTPGQSNDFVMYCSSMKSTEEQGTHSSSRSNNRCNGCPKKDLAQSSLIKTRKPGMVSHCRRSFDSALNSVTATLMAVVVLFLMLVSPSEIIKFIYAKIHIVDSVGKNKHYYYHKIILHVTNFMQALNFSINFILYCAVNKSFRKTLRNLVPFCRQSRPRARFIKRMPPTHCHNLT